MQKETFAHSERGRYRAVTGVAADFPNENGVPTKYATFPTKGTIPAARQLSGTIVSTGVNVRGTNTLFTKEVQEEDFIYAVEGAAGASSIRKVVHVISDTLLVVDAPFNEDIDPAIDLKVIKPQMIFKEVYAKSTGTAAAIMNGSTFPVGMEDHSGGAPLIYDASAANAQISFGCSK
jgi:hypothetical protein